MNGKKLLVITGILVVAVLVIILSEKLTNSSPSSKSALFFPGMTEKDISSVTIKDSNGSVKIRRKGDIWVVSMLLLQTRTAQSLQSGKPRLRLPQMWRSGLLTAHLWLQFWKS